MSGQTLYPNVNPYDDPDFREVSPADVGPVQSFTEQVTEAQEGLWLLRQTMPERPAGKENTFYQTPARFYLPKLDLALDSLRDAAEMAKAEVPKKLQKEALQRFRKDGPSWAEIINEPEMRRFYQVMIVLELLEGVIDDLANEGRPRPAPDLRVGKVRRSS